MNTHNMSTQRLPGYFGRLLRRASSFRALFTAILGLFATVVLGGLFGYVGAYIGIAILALVWGWMVLPDRIFISCPNCGKRVDADVAICRRCGANLHWRRWGE